MGLNFNININKTANTLSGIIPSNVKVLTPTEIRFLESLGYRVINKFYNNAGRAGTSKYIR